MLKVVYLAIMDASKKWSMPSHNWEPALNRFTILYGERVTAKRALERRQSKTVARITQEQWQQVERLIRKHWSPEQITLWLKKHKLQAISHESIYHYFNCFSWSDPNICPNI